MQSKRLSLNSRFPFLQTPCLFASEDPNEQVAPPPGENGEDPEGGAGGNSTNTDERDPQRKIAAQQDEINRHYEARRKAEEERDQLKSFKEEQDRKGRTEVENLQKDLADRDSKIEALVEANKKLVVKNAFLQEQGYAWHNPERALSSVDLSDVEVNEDGTVKNPDALKSAIKKLAEDEPYMLKKEEKEDPARKPSSTGNPPKTSNAQQTAEQKRKALEAKYPALRTRA